MFSKGYLNIYQYGLITDMLRKVTNSLTQKYKSARKDLTKSWVERFWNLKAKESTTKAKRKADRKADRKAGSKADRKAESKADRKVESKADRKVESSCS